LIRDTKEGIDSIKWTAYGKIQRIKKHDGKLWSLASRQFAKGSFREINMFLELSKASPTGFWYRQELPILTSKGLDIITHIK
jgi:hypothetical protein